MNASNEQILIDVSTESLLGARVRRFLNLLFFFLLLLGLIVSLLFLIHEPLDSGGAIIALCITFFITAIWFCAKRTVIKFRLSTSGIEMHTVATVRSYPVLEVKEVSMNFFLSYYIIRITSTSKKNVHYVLYPDSVRGMSPYDLKNRLLAALADYNTFLSNGA